MLRIAVLIKSCHSRVDLKRHFVFAAYFHRVTAEEVLNNQNQRVYDEARKIFREHTLFLINVIVITNNSVQH